MTSLLKIGSKKGKPQDGKQWLHNPESLTQAAVVYLVKFVGVTEVSQAKGTEVIKDAITKVQFANHIKVSEAGKKGSKLRKVDLKISVDAIKVDDTKTKEELYSYPLHHISYCADDKRSKKVFAFIAKDKSSPNHTCYVFECEKMAEELTLTVGQAFDLAYRRYLENVGRQKLQAAEAEKAGMKQKLSQLQESQQTDTGSPHEMVKVTETQQNLFSEPPPSNKQDDFNLLGEMPSVPGIPPPPKQNRSVQSFGHSFDPLAGSFPSSNDDFTTAQTSADLFSDLPASNGENTNMPPSFDQPYFAPNSISSPFDDSPTNLNNVANPFEMFDQPKSSAPSNTFGDSFDPLDQVSSTHSDPTPQSQMTSPFGDNLVDSSPLGSGFGESTNNNFAAKQQVERPRPAARTTGVVSLPPPPSKQSVKAAKLAAASGGVVAQPAAPVANHTAPSSPPSTDLLSMESTSSVNPFPRSPDFDPFADSFDPLDSNPVASNNVDPQFQDLQDGFSRGMKLENKDLFS